MNMNQVRAMAKSKGVKVGGVSKAEAIRRIQRQEGNFDCFATAQNGECDQYDCLFREDCLAESAKH